MKAFGSFVGHMFWKTENGINFNIWKMPSFYLIPQTASSMDAINIHRTWIKDDHLLAYGES